MRMFVPECPSCPSGRHHMSVPQTVTILSWLCSVCSAVAVCFIICRVFLYFHCLSSDRGVRWPRHFRQDFLVHSDDQCIAGNVHCVAPVYLCLALFTKRSWETGGRRSRGSIETDAWTASVDMGSRIYWSSAFALHLMNSFAELSCLAVGCFCCCRWFVNHMSASGSEVTRCVVLSIRDAWYLPLRVFVVQLECLVLSMCQCLMQWFERSVECSTVLRKRLRYMTYSKAIARAFVAPAAATGRDRSE